MDKNVLLTYSKLKGHIDYWIIWVWPNFLLKIKQPYQYLASESFGFPLFRDKTWGDKNPSKRNKQDEEVCAYNQY